MSARVGVVLFPGSNCEFDVIEAVRRLGGEAEILWHGDEQLRGVDAVVVPGGFAHGDYLRPGAIARFSPIMPAVAEFAREGGPVAGICNGFQVLTEAGLLPGALQKNRGLKFLCTTVELRVETADSVLTSAVEPGEVRDHPEERFLRRILRVAGIEHQAPVEVEKRPLQRGHDGIDGLRLARERPLDRRVLDADRVHGLTPGSRPREAPSGR